MRIPIAAAKAVGKQYGASQVILLAQVGDMTHVVTWGKTLDDCRLAAESGNNLKRQMGWPEHKCNAKPARVKTAERRAGGE